MGVSMVFQWLYNGVSRVFQDKLSPFLILMGVLRGSNYVSFVFQRYLEGVLRRFHERSDDILRVSKGYSLGCFKSVSAAFLIIKG